MAIYDNAGGNSGVAAYEIGDNWIEVEFKRGKHRHYLYDYNSTGEIHVETMKKLAHMGHGLNSYITSTVKGRYHSKR